MDLALDPDTGDLLITEGRLTLVSGLERITQQARIRFRTFRGEVFYDELAGIPYWERILGVKPLRRSVVTSVMRQALEGIPGVRDVYDLTFDYDPATRAAAVEWRAFVDDVDGPFVFSDSFRLA